MMRGHLKFLDGQDNAFIQFDFPARTDETAASEEVELTLFGTRTSQATCELLPVVIQCQIYYCCLVLLFSS